MRTSKQLRITTVNVFDSKITFSVNLILKIAKHGKETGHDKYTGPFRVVISLSDDFRWRQASTQH